MRTGTVKALLKRELLDICRDKKTMAMMILLPIILYPLLIVAMVFIMGAVTASQEEKTYNVALEVPADQQSELLSLLDEEKDKVDYKLKVMTMAEVEEKLSESESKDDALDQGAKEDAAGDTGEENAEDDSRDDLLTRALKAKTINAYVTQTDEGNYEIRYQSANSDSNIAKNALSTLMDLYEDDLRKDLIENAGLNVTQIMEPITVKRTDISSKEESVGNQIGSLLPFFIITSVLLGAMYPAIDVTAGEKERGTLETLLTLPVTNLEMILSKFFAVSIIACISAFLNLFSMSAALIFLMSSSVSMSSDLNLSLDYAVFLPGIGFTLLVMLFFSMLVTAVCMCTCIFAKSFKEANNYATPVMLIFMFGGYATLLPNLELTQKTAILPIVNVALMIKSLFGFESNLALYGLVLLTNVAYSLLAIWVLSRLYNSEAVLFSEGFTSIHVFEKRSDMKEGQMPGGGDVILVLTVTLLLMIYVGSYAVAKLEFLGLGVQQGMILLCPIIYAWYIKADKKKLFSLNRPKLIHFVGGLLMGAGALVLAMYLGAFLAPLFPESAQGVVDLEDWMQGQPVILLVTFTALMPAVGEELLFRGFLMGTLKEKYKPVVAVLVTAVVFAVYHMSILRFFTVGVIGLSLTIAAYKSGSIFVSMTMHFLNNLAAVLISYYHDSATYESFTDTLTALTEHVGAAVLIFVIGVACAAVGFKLVGYKSVRTLKDGAEG